MNWSTFFYVLIITFVYVPMVFMGVNVFFPDFVRDDFYRYESNCHQKFRLPQEFSEQQRLNYDDDLSACLEEFQEKRVVYEEEKREYESWKYLFVTGFNLIILLIATFVLMGESVMMGLFLGSVTATFFATVNYMDTKSKLGFTVLVVLFFLTLFFINRRKEVFLTNKKKKKK